MKQSTKNEVDLVELINKIQGQLIVLDKKVDTLINRSITGTRPVSTPPVNTPRVETRPNNQNNRMMYSAVCADCNKECKIPFKPSGDRPVYCQDCFSRRKVISMSGMKVDLKPQNNIPAVPEAPVKKLKKAVAVKKSVSKKKSVPKKK